MAASNIEGITSGKVIFKQGSDYDYLVFLVEGSVELLSADKEYADLDETLLLKHSKRVGTISEKTFLSGFSDKTIKALTDCKVQKIPLPQKGIVQFAVKNPGQTITLLLHLFRRTEAAYSDVNKTIKFYKTLAALNDNLAVLFTEISAKDLSPRLSSIKQDISANFNSSNLPATFDCSFLINDKSDIYHKKYEIPNLSISNSFDKKQYAFLKRFLKIDKKIFAHLINADPGICDYIYKTTSGYFTSFLDNIYASYESIEHQMDLLFGKEDSWFEALFKNDGMQDCTSSGRLSSNFMQQFPTIVAKLYKTYSEMSGENAEDLYPGMSYLKSYLQTQSLSSPQKSAGTVSGDSPAASESGDKVLRLYDNSLQQIFKFSVAGEQLQKDILTSLNEFKKMENPFTTDSDARKIRRKISNLYWNLFFLVYIRMKSEKNIPAPVKLMINYGFIDENMATPEQIIYMHNAIKVSEKTEIPVITEIDFLNKIYDGKTQPSINEMGLDFRKYLLEISRTASRKGPNPMDKLEDPTAKVEFEIHNMLASTVSTCSGSRSSAFPIFSDKLIAGDLSRLHVSKTMVEKKIKELLSIDYSAYYRETVFKHEDSREVILEEVKPFFILLPSYGTKIMMWQELSGTNKRSRARIVIPRFYMGNLFEDLAHATAVFRWELNRTMKGGMWADPVEGGLTGFYSDYVQFYKKNSQLSREAKDKVKQRLASARNNARELFAQDYILWVTFEQQGIMKMNTVARDLFYRFVPFSSEIRERLTNMPAFTESARRFKNIRNRDYKAYQRKFKKFEDENGNLPEALQKHMDYFTL